MSHWTETSRPCHLRRPPLPGRNTESALFSERIRGVPAETVKPIFGVPCVHGCKRVRCPHLPSSSQPEVEIMTEHRHENSEAGDQFFRPCHTWDFASVRSRKRSRLGSAGISNF